MSKGPLAGLRVVEFASIGPGPHCAMWLADMGADVLRLDRKGGNGWDNPIVDRGRHTLTLDIRSDEGRAVAISAAAKADVLIEGMRPGVMERLGLGPDVLLARNPRLIYGRVTGWGQTGPLAKAAGHDLNYIAVTGALSAIGKPGEPATPPLNFVGDFGGGSMFLITGILAALYERERSGKGQIVDAAIVDGTAHLMSFFAGLLPGKQISLERDQNLLGGAAHFYRCYLCKDGGEIAVGPIEPQFYKDFLDRIGAPQELYADQNDQSQWAKRSEQLAAIFRTKTRAEWAALLEGTDACAAPVLSLEESHTHPHMAERYAELDGLKQPAPAPLLSRTPGAAVASKADGEELLKSWSV
jgi:alpha-methylacyl-CoA racemase